MTAMTSVTGAAQKPGAQKATSPSDASEGTRPNPFFSRRDRVAFCAADFFELEGIREGVHE